MKTSKTAPKKPVFHCNPDVTPAFSDHQNPENPCSEPLFKTVSHRDPSLPISVRIAFNSGYGMLKRWLR